MHFNRLSIIYAFLAATTHVNALEERNGSSWISNGIFSTDNMSQRDLRAWDEIYAGGQVDFTDDLYKEYNEIKGTIDYVDGEVVLCADGSRVAIKGTDAQNGDFYAIYESDSARRQWIYAFPIDTTNRQTIPGTSISLSADGKGTAVAGLQCNPDSEAQSGVICYDFANQQGPNFDNDVGSDWSDSFGSYGTSVSLNGESTVLAVGSSRGRVYVYFAQNIILLGKLDDARIGNYINVGNRPGSTFGQVVKVVGDVSTPTVFVGGEGNKVAAYRFSSSNGTWRKLGNDIIAERGGSTFDVADNGSIVAIRHDNSFVKVFEYITNRDGTTEWVQKGQDLDAGAGKLASLSISRDGKVVAVGSYNGSDNASGSPGVVRLYEYGRSNWRPFSLVVEDTRLRSGIVDFGRSVSLSEDGTILAVAAPAFSSVSDKTQGYVAMFEASDPFPSAAPMLLPTSVPTSPPSYEPTKSSAPSKAPVISPTSPPTVPPTYSPTSSVRPSISPTISRPPTPFPSPLPTPSTCEHDCECKEGGECDLSQCRYNCNCEEGFCDMQKCEYDCRCKGGNCNMNRCGSNCQCEMRGCQMDNCIYNTRCVARNETSGAHTSNKSLAVSILLFTMSSTVAMFIM